MPHSAALIAGGKSTRMGRDKAALILRGRPLWRHQLDTLAATGPDTLFVAGDCTAIPDGEAILFPDEWPDSGPLGGIATALAHTTAPWLLVLAVDMPRVNAGFLARLIAHAEMTGRGAVPMLDDQWEPLAAVYPVTAFPIARQTLTDRRLALRHFIEAAQLAAFPVAESERGLFANVNTQEDWAAVS